MPPALQQWFAHQTVEESRARLSEAGAGPGIDVLLPDVFIDLTVSSAERGGMGDCSAIAQLVGTEHHVFRGDAEVNTTIATNTVLVLGGPGEGKSSLTAMTALLLRERWISDTDSWAPDFAKDYLRASASIRAHRTEAHTKLPWLPLRVDLPSFAPLKAASQESSVWDWLGQQYSQFSSGLGRMVPFDLDAELRKAGPICWIFDGLDEVPHGPTRDAIVAEIHAFCARGDRVVVTTRPQTYRDELAKMTEFVIDALDEDRAKSLSHKLVSAWTQHSREAANDARARVDSAFGRDDVRALATTPLHVTLLSVVAVSRELPSNPSALFDAFFDALFRRELTKKVDPEVLESDGNILRTLHERVALVLQTRAQLAEFSASVLAEVECRSMLVDAFITRDFDEDHARRRAHTLLRFSRDRLVLLRRMHSDGYGFGVRSFQEYFAACALLDAPDELARDRVLSIVVDPFWSNVVRLAACELLRHQDQTAVRRAKTVLVEACERIAAWPEEQLYQCRTDARVAVLLLEATLAVDAPWVQKRLAEIVATALFNDGFEDGEVTWFQLGFPPQTRPAPALLRAWTRCGSITVDPPRKLTWFDSFEARLIEAATFWFHSERPWRAWTLISAMLSKNTPAATVLARQFEPRSPTEASALWNVFEARISLDSDWLRDFLRRRFAWIDPRPAERGDSTISFTNDPTLVGTLDESITTAPALIVDTSAGTISLYSYTSRDESTRVFVAASDADNADVPAIWRASRAIQQYEDDPTPATLALALRAIPPCSAEQQRQIALSQHSWPLASCLLWAGNAERCLIAAQFAEEGALGTADDWERFNDRVLNNGLTLTVDEVIALDCSDRAPWQSTIATEGLPIPLDGSFTDQQTLPHTATKMTPLLACLARIGAIERFSDEQHAAWDASHPWHVVPPYISSAPPERSNLPQTTEALLAMRYASATSEHDRDRAQTELLTRIVRPRSSRLTRESTWRELSLPGISPERAQRRAMPFTLDGIHTLSGLRAFAHSPEVLGSLPTPPPNRGQWIVLLGENGCGKTTLLRAIALALLDQDTATKLLTARLRLLRNGEPGHVQLTVNGGAFECRVHRTPDNEEAVESIASDTVHRPWVVAYGVRRSTALGEPDRSAELRGVANLHSLFELPSALVHAPTWLDKQWKLVLSEQSKNRKEKLEPEYKGPDERAWDAISLAFNRILGISEIDADGREIYVRHPAFGRVRFDQLSDGYLTTAGWIIDLVARWIAHHANESLPNDILANITGLVLIDEIDLHLHPTWQLRIIDDVRTLFPKLSFIVTTHNPLTVHGAKPGEVFVMRREERETEQGKKQIAVIEQRDVLAGSDIDRVLLDLFDVRDTLDSPTRELLDEHMALLRAGTSPDDPRRQAVEDKIRTTLGAGGASLVTQRGERVAPLGKVSEKANANAVAWFGEEE